MAEPRFLVDSMLGKLARWLILLGYDAAFEGAGRPDLELLEQARREGRIFLTRDTKIPEVTGVRKLVLRQQSFEVQLAFVMETLGLKARLSRLSREKALPLVPPLVRELRTDFFRCPSCGRLYWSGTHTERAIKKIRRLGLAVEGENG